MAATSQPPAKTQPRLAWDRRSTGRGPSPSRSAIAATGWLAGEARPGWTYASGVFAIHGSSDVTCDRGERTLRLNCIDAPETDQHPWGERATRALRQGIDDTVRVVAHDQDQYGRTIATIFSADGDHDLNLGMVRAGHAAVYDRYCDRAAYQRAETSARDDGRGIWSEPGLQQKPWRYRHQN